MNNSFFNAHDLDEVVFENRNKAYGAYALRRSYESNLNKAMLLTLAFFVSLLAFGILFHLAFPPAVVDRIIHETPITPTTIVIEGITRLRQAANFRQAGAPRAGNPDNNNYDIHREPATTAPVPGPQNGNGEQQGPSHPAALPGLSAGDGTDSVSAPPAPTVFVNDKIIHEIVPQMPEFPGGEQAMIDYIRHKIAYPENAVRNQREGVVLVSFVIDVEGNVTLTGVDHSVGFGCDEEALRVVQGMPRWKPGRMADHPVPVRLRLPVRFRMQ
jgi:protein TonB